MKIRFLVDRVVRDEKGVVVVQFRKGQIVDLVSASANHWLNRAVAEEVTTETPKQPELRPLTPKPVVAVEQSVSDGPVVQATLAKFEEAKPIQEELRSSKPQKRSG